MAVTTADVRQVAALARLELDEAHLPSLVAELNRILMHIDELQQVVLAHADAADRLDGMMLRADDALPVALQLSREQFAPHAREGFFLVPRLATHGDAGASAGASVGEDEL